MKPTERFTNRVESYIKYRPTYPKEIPAFLTEKIGLNKASVIADIGSGTGISARLFLENGNTVFGVEPNRAMREAAEEFLKDLPAFKSVDGTSTNTGLPEDSVDLIVAAQSFHWFEPAETRVEFQRILRPEGYVVLIWNERQTDTTPFLREYEQFLLEFANDYTQVRHENTGKKDLREFFPKEFWLEIFPNEQILDLAGLKGRVLSSSYMPAAGEGRHQAMMEALAELFTKYQESGRITILYDTKVYYGQL